jgi:hypothetical protein
MEDETAAAGSDNALNRPMADRMSPDIKNNDFVTLRRPVNSDEPAVLFHHTVLLSSLSCP